MRSTVFTTLALCTAACSGNVSTTPPDGMGGATTATTTTSSTTSTTSSSTTSTSSSTTEGCLPQSKAPCDCPGGPSGTKTCLDDGSGFGLCMGCTAADVPWSHSFGEVDASMFGHVAVTADNSVLATWFGDGFTGYRRFDPAGNTVWDQASSPGAYGQITPHADGGFLFSARVTDGGSSFLGISVACAATPKCSVVGRVGSNGIASWVRVLDASPGNQPWVLMMGSSAEGAIGFLGFYQGVVDLGTGLLDETPTSETQYVVAVLSPQGQTVWSRSIGFGDAPLVDINVGKPVFTASGDLIVSGHVKQQIDFGAGALPIPQGARVAFVARYDASGNLLFHRLFGDTSDSNCWVPDVAADDHTTLVATHCWGSFDLGGGPIGAVGTLTHAAVELDSAGALVHQHTIAEESDDSGVFQISRAKGGGAWLCSQWVPGMKFAGQVVQNPSEAGIVIMRYDAAWNPIEVRTFGATGGVSCQDLVVGDLGAPVIVANLAGTIDFGQGPLTAVGKIDAAFAKLAP